MVNVLTEPRVLSPETQELIWLCSASKAPQLRTMRQFADQEIIIPDGPFEGRRFNCDRQPFTRLWFDAVDSGKWQRFVVTGCQQSGKTLSACVIPLTYHLFEYGETAIFGLPDMNMASDKWREDIEPIIARSRYKDLIPWRGAGSRGGKVSAIQFRNNATLKFMSAKGSVKSISGYTSRVLVATEIDGFDTASSLSDEAGPLRQMEGRTRAYDTRRRIYLECTVSTAQGRTWQEYTSGTESRIAMPCPHCGEYVTLGREHLTGYQDANDELEAKETGAFVCSECGELWQESERTQAASKSVLLHRCQAVTKDGEAEGPVPRTETLGFRWSAVDNLLVSAGTVAAEEWNAARAEKPDDAERALLQWVWALPYEGEETDITPLDIQKLITRQGGEARGFIPPDAQYLTAALDMGKHVCWWGAVAWSAGGTPHLVDWGEIGPPSRSMPLEKALGVAEAEFRDIVEHGWPRAGVQMHPGMVCVDSGWKPEPVYDFCRGLQGWIPFKGWGTSQEMAGVYTAPKQQGKNVRQIGNGYHVAFNEAQRTWILHSDVDQWKSFVHDRLSVPLGEPGAMTFFKVQRDMEHLTLGKHLTAEKAVEIFHPTKGKVIVWEKESRSRPNHMLDVMHMNCVLGHALGVRVKQTPVAPPQGGQPGISVPEGARFSIKRD